MIGQGLSGPSSIEVNCSGCGAGSMCRWTLARARREQHSGVVHVAGTRGWQIGEGIASHLAMALYVRDAAGLSPYVLTEPDVGALHPPVPAPPPEPAHAADGFQEAVGDVHVGAGIDLRLAAREWPIWWARALQQAPPETAPVTPEEMLQAAPPAAPDWHGLEDLATMRALAQEHHDDFWRWLDEVTQEEISHHRVPRGLRGRRRGGSDPLDLTRFVNGYERRLGRAVRPFTLHLRLLPLAEPVGWVLDEHQVLLSTRLREDAPALERLLAPVIAALA